MNTYLDRMLGRVSNQYDKAVGGYFFDMLEPVSEELADIDSENLKMLDRGFADTAEGADLDRVVGEIGMSRKIGAYASVVLRFSGEDGEIIPYGTQANSETASFTTTEQGTIAGGYVDVTAICEVYGSAGNVAANTINKCKLSDITVTNPAAAAGGVDNETNTALRERYYFEVQHPPGSGNKYDYIRWALEVDGCSGAKCYPLWNGNGTVKVVIIGQSGTASTDLIHAVKMHIESKRPVGAEVTIAAATPVAINVAVTLLYEDGYTANEMLEAAKTVIKNDLQKIAFKSIEVSFARIGALLYVLPGVRDYSNLKINGGTANIVIDDDEIAVLGAVSIA